MKLIIEWVKWRSGVCLGMILSYLVGQQHSDPTINHHHHLYIPIPIAFVPQTSLLLPRESPWLTEVITLDTTMRALTFPLLFVCTEFFLSSFGSEDGGRDSAIESPTPATQTPYEEAMDALSSLITKRSRADKSNNGDRFDLIFDYIKVMNSIFFYPALLNQPIWRS